LIVLFGAWLDGFAHDASLQVLALNEMRIPRLLRWLQEIVT
jgi:hypothetical protein